MGKKTGLVHIYYGNGKGKTTAAFGLALRFAGYGCGVVIAQFLKNRTSGEVNAIGKFKEVTVIRNCPINKFTFQMDEFEKAQLSDCCKKLFNEVVTLSKSNDVGLLILDECLDVCSNNYLPISHVIEFLDSKPENLEVVFTGHCLPKELEMKADYISNIKKEKHPYDKGIAARKCIEY